jgi:hypothetical protein
MEPDTGRPAQGDVSDPECDDFRDAGTDIIGQVQQRTGTDDRPVDGDAKVLRKRWVPPVRFSPSQAKNAILSTPEQEETEDMAHVASQYSASTYDAPDEHMASDNIYGGGGNRSTLVFCE